MPPVKSETADENDMNETKNGKVDAPDFQGTSKKGQMEAPDADDISKLQTLKDRAEPCCVKLQDLEEMECEGPPPGCLEEFSENTTLHGLQYIGDTERSLIERLGWLGTVAISAVSCIFYILTLLDRWNSSPVLVTFADHSTLISEIPFPAVTICPDNAVPKSKYNLDGSEFVLPYTAIYDKISYYGIFYEGASSNFTFFQYAPVLKENLNSSEKVNNFDINLDDFNFDDFGNLTVGRYARSINKFDAPFNQSFGSDFFISGFSDRNSTEGPTYYESDIYGDGANSSIYWQAITMMCANLKYIIPLNRTHVMKLIEVSTDISQMPVCRWKSESSNCSWMFRPFLTDEGLCFTFNMLSNKDLFTPETDVHADLLGEYVEDLNVTAEVEGDLGNTTSNSTGSVAPWNAAPKEWDPDKGYHETATMDAFPYRVNGRGSNYGLEVLLASTMVNELQPMCWPNAKSFKVILHAPTEFPKVSDAHFRVPLNSLMNVVVYPAMITTSEALRPASGYTPESRGCFFGGERNLTFFKVYTQTNCETERLAKRIHLNCLCVPFFLPRLKTNKSRYCGSHDIECMRNTEMGIVSNKTEEAEAESVPELPCLPGCTEHKYDVELSSSLIDREEIAAFTNDPTARELEQSRVSIYFKDSQFITSQRREQYGLIDFIANCGGLLGLFTGFSLISGIEVVYYLTVRMLCRIKKKMKGADGEDNVSQN